MSPELAASYERFVELYPRSSGSLSAIAREIGISRQRAHQLFRNAVFEGKIKRIYPKCIACGERFERINRSRRCPECRQKNRWPPMACRKCGVDFLPTRYTTLCQNCTRRKKRKLAA